MAKNPPKNNRRRGAVKKRDQVLNPRNKRWVKRNLRTGKFLDQKADYALFKGIRKNK